MTHIPGDLSVNEIIRLLNLTPHPEGGWYRETYRADTREGARPTSTLIYYLLAADQVSAWHRIDADEVWFWHAGAPLALTLSSPNGQGADAYQLGPSIRSGQAAHLLVPALHWQTAESLGAWTLLSCMVAPGFEFSGFQLAAPDWRPTL